MNRTRRYLPAYCHLMLRIVEQTRIMAAHDKLQLVGLSLGSLYHYIV